METALERILTHSHKKRMIAYVSKNPACFNELIPLTLGDKPPYSWRAAWLLWSCMEKNDDRLKKHVGKMIDLLAVRKDNQQREFLKILQQMKITSRLEGKLFDRCVEIWKNPGKQPSVRFNAFRIIQGMAGKYPELRRELSALTQERYLESLSPGAKHSITKLIAGNKRSFLLNRS